MIESDEKQVRENMVDQAKVIHELRCEIRSLKHQIEFKNMFIKAQHEKG